MKIILDILNSLDYTITIKSINSNIIEVCNPLYLNTSNLFLGKKIIKIDGNFITLENVSGLEVNQKITLPKLTFVRGNFRDGRNEIAHMQQEDINTYPICFLYENPLTEVWSRNVFNIEVNLKILFLNRTSFQYEDTGIKWTTNDHYNECIIPMKNVARLFYSYINDSGIYKVKNDVLIENLKDFGIYRENDTEKNLALIEYNLSGCSMELNLLYNEKNCC